MTRKIACVLLCLLLISSTASANLPKIPTRYTFAMAYDRVNTAIAREKPVTFAARVEAESIMGIEGDLLGALVAALGGLEVSGTVQAYKDGGGYLDITALSGGRALLSLSQMARDGRVGLSVNGETVSMSQGRTEEAAGMLMLEGLGQALLDMDYAGLAEGEIPFLTSIYQQGIDLWRHASPYVEENNRLRVSSGATSHGQTYTIDTMAMRSILNQWADGMSRDGLFVGFAGTELFFGVSETAFDAFVGKVRNLAQTAELSKPIKLNMAFGEGDLLQTAKGSGTISVGGKRTGISYNYSCNVSSTRVTRKYSLDFQPAGGDTIVLTCTWLTSSNNKKSGSRSVSISANGVYDGQPYRIKINSEMVNKFVLADDGLLTEVITGTATASVKYGGVDVLNVTVDRSGEMNSALGQAAITIAELLDVTIETDQGTLFKGTVDLSIQVEDSQWTAPELYLASPLEQLDFSEVETLRAALTEAIDAARRGLAGALPKAAIEALFSKH